MRGLVLFDIDATLLTTRGAGVGALGDAGRELWGPAFRAEGLRPAGSLDPLLIDELLEMNGLARCDEHRARLRARYAVHLERRLAAGGARALPGALALVGVVSGSVRVAAGVLTGNFPETGRMKLTAAGFDPGAFGVVVWGDDSPRWPPRRDHLPIVALERHRARYGVEADPGLVTVIGDTVHDVACARAHGCRSIGVGTGPASVEELWAAGADLAVADLTDTGGLAAWVGA